MFIFKFWCTVFWFEGLWGYIVGPSCLPRGFSLGCGGTPVGLVKLVIIIIIVYYYCLAIIHLCWSKVSCHYHNKLDEVEEVEVRDDAK